MLVSIKMFHLLLLNTVFIQGFSKGKFSQTGLIPGKLELQTPTSHVQKLPWSPPFPQFIWASVCQYSKFRNINIESYLSQPFPQPSLYFIFYSHLPHVLLLHPQYFIKILRDEQHLPADNTGKGTEDMETHPAVQTLCGRTQEQQGFCLLSQKKKKKCSA